MAIRAPLTVVLVALLAACQPAATTTPSQPISTAASATPVETPATGTVYPLTLTDDAGRDVTITADPQRIVSLAPSNTEIACVVDACDELVGITDYDAFPPEVSEIDDVVIGAQVDVEKVVAAEPDLVLAAGNGITPDAILEQLDELGLTVLVLYPETLDEIYADIELVGEALDEADAAAQQVATMKEQIAQVTDALDESADTTPRVFYEVSVFEGQIYTAGESSFVASMIELAGGEPIIGDAVTTVIGLEDLVAADPEVILLGDAAYDPTVTPQAVANRPGWGEMTAVVNARVQPMPDDLVITRPGPRIAQGVLALARAIHPEVFNR
jgi:iron complex transport system substrate-binding protein